MFGLKAKHQLQVLALVLFIAAFAYASASGPDARHTNAPGDLGNCTACHDKVADIPDTGPGMVRINNTPAIYDLGKEYTIAVNVQHGGRQKFGFQLTAIDSNGNRAGTLAPISTDTTQLNQSLGVGGRQYIQHTSNGTAGQSARTWQIRWIAPSTDMGPVRFYVAANAADGNGTQEGLDYIYTSNALSDSPLSIVSVSFASEPDGQTLEAGTTFNIGWNVTNPSNIDNIEVRLSTDDGDTFPVSTTPFVNPIFFTTDGNIPSFEWTVPDISTTEARIRVQVGTKAGSVVEVRSGRFTISGTGSPTPSGLRITSAFVTGKKLFVKGEGFQQGAKVELNGDTQKTSNEEDFSISLVCKKAGKKIARGSTVSLVVRNPDGTRSEPFMFTRPEDD